MVEEFKQAKAPTRRWKEGNITLTEWENSNGFPEFSIQKSFKKDGKWVNLQSCNFNLQEVDKLQVALQKLKFEIYQKNEEVRS